jgi:hypothetical protein
MGDGTDVGPCAVDALAPGLCVDDLRSFLEDSGCELGFDCQTGEDLVPPDAIVGARRWAVGVQEDLQL